MDLRGLKHLLETTQDQLESFNQPYKNDIEIGHTPICKGNMPVWPFPHGCVDDPYGSHGLNIQGHARVFYPCGINFQFEPIGVFTQPDTRLCPWLVSLTRPRHARVSARVQKP